MNILLCSVFLSILLGCSPERWRSNWRRSTPSLKHGGLRRLRVRRRVALLRRRVRQRRCRVIHRRWRRRPRWREAALRGEELVAGGVGLGWVRGGGGGRRRKSARRVRAGLDHDGVRRAAATAAGGVGGGEQPAVLGSLPRESVPVKRRGPICNYWNFMVVWVLWILFFLINNILFFHLKMYVQEQN